MNARLSLALLLSALSLVACKKTTPAVPDAAPADAAPVVLETPDAAAEAPDASLAALNDAGHAHAGPPTMPGACVDPMADAKSHASGAGPTIASTPDLDGDGKPDKLLAFSGSGVAKSFTAYVMRGTCGHFVGTLNAATLTPAKSKSHGLDDLAGFIPCANGKHCNCTTQEFTARFNGKAYFQGPLSETLKQCGPLEKP